MKGTPAIYKGRIIDKKVFRAFIYGANNEKKLVESWDAFEAAMQSGIWFASRQNIVKVKPDSKLDLEIELKGKHKSTPKSKQKTKAKPKAEKIEEIEDSENVLADDAAVFEVKDES